MKNRKVPKASIVLVIAALFIVVAGSAIAVFADPEFISEDYKSEFEMDHIDVMLMENGRTSEEIQTGTLLSEIGGEVVPGRLYKEELAAKNVRDVDELVRMIVKVYWIDRDGKKTASMDPDLIRLTYDDREYNSSAWQINPAETTRERRVYYYSHVLAGGASTEPVVNRLVLDSKVVDDMSVTTETNNGKTIYTYKYRYDGYAVCIEADVQSLQVHNADEAILGTWGVDNVTVSDDGAVTVR